MRRPIEAAVVPSLPHRYSPSSPRVGNHCGEAISTLIDRHASTRVRLRRPDPKPPRNYLLFCEIVWQFRARDSRSPQIGYGDTSKHLLPTMVSPSPVELWVASRVAPDAPTNASQQKRTHFCTDHRTERSLGLFSTVIYRNVVLYKSMVILVAANSRIAPSSTERARFKLCRGA